MATTPSAPSAPSTTPVPTYESTITIQNGEVVHVQKWVEFGSGPWPTVSIRRWGINDFSADIGGPDGGGPCIRGSFDAAAKGLHENIRATYKALFDLQGPAAETIAALHPPLFFAGWKIERYTTLKLGEPIDADSLGPNTKLLIQTTGRTYAIEKKDDGVYASGHPVQCPAPRKIAGSGVPQHSCIRIAGGRLEILFEGAAHRVITTPVEKIETLETAHVTAAMGATFLVHPND